MAVTLKLNEADADTVARILKATAVDRPEAASVLHAANYKDVTHPELRAILTRLAAYIDTVVSAG